MLNRFAAFYNQLVLGTPAVVLAALACLLLFFAYHAKDFKLDASADSLLLENDEDLRKFREINERYETEEFVFVTFSPEAELFSDASLRTITNIRDEILKVDGIASVISLVDVPLLKVVGGGKLSEMAENYRTLKDKDVDREMAKQELLHSPLYTELALSADGRAAATQIFFEHDQEYEALNRQRNTLQVKKYGQTLNEQEKHQLGEINARYDEAKTRVDRERGRIITEIRGIVDNYRDQGELHLGGIPMIAVDMITYIKNDLVVFGIGVFLFMIVMLSIIFRRIRWVMLPLLSCAFASLLMIGLLGLIGWRVTVISSNFISLMLILTMSMNVHLVVRYRQLQRDNPHLDQRQLVFETTGKMVWPCLYTALTTMMGFGSLVVSGIKPVIDFGWMMTFGLSVTFLTTFLLFPAILVLLGKQDGGGTEREEVPFTAVLANITERHGGKVLLLSVVLAITSIVGIGRLRVENSFINYFGKETEIYQGLKLIDEKLGGTTPLDIILHLGDRIENAEQGAADGDNDDFDEMNAMFGEIEVDKSDYWFTPERLDLIKSVHDYLEALPAVGKVQSLASTVRVAEDLMEGQEFDTFELAIIYKRLPEELRVTMLNPYISIEHDEAHITLRIKDSIKDLRRKELLQQIHDDLIGRLGLSEEQFEITGLMVLYNNMLQSLFRSQVLTLGVVMLGIGLMLLVLFQSASLAVIGIIPNILAAAIILGLMGLLDIPLDMMTITIAAITIGIAVDNSIHYIYRFREEFARNRDYHTTLHYCHANIGRAVFYTAITIIVGFSILMMSNFIPSIYFGLLTALAMLIALLAALTLLPKLILLWKPF